MRLVMLRMATPIDHTTDLLIWLSKTWLTANEVTIVFCQAGRRSCRSESYIMMWPIVWTKSVNIRVSYIVQYHICCCVCLLCCQCSNWKKEVVKRKPVQNSNLHSSPRLRVRPHEPWSMYLLFLTHRRLVVLNRVHQDSYRVEYSTSLVSA
jgi:hypothetical protein